MHKQKIKIRTLLRSILLLIISLFLGTALYLWNAETLVGNAMPMPFGFGISAVLSGSMEPEFSTDDLVIVQSSDDYKIGDVVVYQDGNILVMHRIIAIDNDSITTKGDANDLEDTPIKKETIKGKVIAQIPKAGAAILFLKSPIGFLIMLAGAVILFELPYYSERRKMIEEQEKIKQEIQKIKEQSK